MSRTATPRRSTAQAHAESSKPGSSGGEGAPGTPKSRRKSRRVTSQQNAEFTGTECEMLLENPREETPTNVVTMPEMLTKDEKVVIENVNDDAGGAASNKKPSQSVGDSHQSQPQLVRGTANDDEVSSPAPRRVTRKSVSSSYSFTQLPERNAAESALPTFSGPPAVDTFDKENVKVFARTTTASASDDMFRTPGSEMVRRRGVRGKSVSAGQLCRSTKKVRTPRANRSSLILRALSPEEG